jgi:hypothetical protein
MGVFFTPPSGLNLRILENIHNCKNKGNFTLYKIILYSKILGNNKKNAWNIVGKCVILSK